MREGLWSQTRGNGNIRDDVSDLCGEDQRQALNLTNEKKRKCIEEPAGRKEGDDVDRWSLSGDANLSNNDGFRMQETGECSMSLEVDLGSYKMIEMGACSRGPPVFPSMLNRGLEKDDSTVGSCGFEVNTEGNNKDKIMGLELIARLQNRTKGFRRLTKIHGANMMNSTEDTCPRRSLMNEILQELLRNSQAEVCKSHEKEVVHGEGKGGNTVEIVNEKLEKVKLGCGARTTRARRQQSTQDKRTVLSWMTDMGAILPLERVYYLDHQSKRALLCGDVVGGCIRCDCCLQSVSISEFEAHSLSKLSEIVEARSRSQVSEPLRNICVERGPSLLQCMAQAWNNQPESARKVYHFVRVEGRDQNDDICNLCGEGGDLICCDCCTSAFHQNCLGIQILPSGDWHCMYCRCKFCGLYGGKEKDSSEGFFQSMISECRICEQKYHQSCLEANRATTVHSKEAFLCGNGCKELSERLKMLFGVKNEIEDGLSWSFIWRSDVDSTALEIKPHMVESNAKLAVAVSSMNEGFMPCIDKKRGINVIHSVLYNCGSNFTRLDCKRFVTAILERDDEIISVASIRIHGNQLAEMPYVATRSIYRRKGMCSRLLKAIELALSFLNVELLVIPAISKLRETWISAFGFEPIDSRSKTIIKGMNLLVFPDTVMLQKKIPKRNFPNGNLIPTEVSNLKRSARQCKGKQKIL
ncbi:Increased DNA methylation 1 [Spatholobus suberectus]|nr:Increased DNA methylation 1 [Spatholobus suberectus]